VVEDNLAAYLDMASLRPLQAGNGPQGGRLSRAGWAKQH
jgi:hypothetical protein